MHETVIKPEPEKTSKSGIPSSSAVQVINFTAPGIVCYNSPPRPGDDIGRLLLGFISIKKPPTPLYFAGEQAQ